MNDAKRPHRRLVSALVVLGTVMAVLAIFSVWIERQALHTDEWVQTSERLLEDEVIEVALADYLTEELFANVDVQAELQARLPQQVKPLAGPLAGALRQLFNQAARRALASPRVQAAWAEANRAAHEVLVDVVEGDRDATVTLELRPLVADLTERAGIGADVASKLPPEVATLEILSQDQIEAAQKVAKLVRGLAILFSILALGSLGVAIYLARGYRTTTMLWCGAGLIIAGVAALALRRVAGNAVVEALVTNESATDAGDATWSIGTSLMRGIAFTVIIYGVLFGIAALLGSETRSARAVRKRLAPTLRDRPGLVYGLLAIAALVYLALAPTHGLRALLTLAILVAIAAFGIAALRRQTAEEFPRA
jgi:hypothetical protein